MHWSGVIGDYQVCSLNQCAQCRKGQGTSQAMHMWACLSPHCVENTLDKFALVLSSREQNRCTQPLHQQVNDPDIHVPGIGTRRHTTTWMYNNLGSPLLPL